jgi:AcrR family transcriptional regulator
MEGLRERKKRLMRQLISDTATVMFLERGFDEVRVCDVAAACDVSEKTVYNYFPTKESLLLDREEDMATKIRQALGPGSPARSPIDAALAILRLEVDEMRTNWSGDRASGVTDFRRFTDLIDGTPSLRAAQRDMMDRLVRVAAEAMAERVGVSPDDPEPQIAAAAILGLWRIQFHAMRRYGDGVHTPEAVYAQVTSEVHRAARLIDSGLWAFSVMAEGVGGREQLRVAAEAAQHAGRQVAMALRQARSAWRQFQLESDPDAVDVRTRARQARRQGQGDQRDLRVKRGSRPRPAPRGD